MQTGIKSLSYHDFLIESIKDPEEAAGYLEAIMEEKDPESLLLKQALANVGKALGEGKLSQEELNQHLEALEQLLSVQGSREIYLLGLWLNTLGLKLTVTVEH
ncbi:MAG TPA: transcriptional regulator [Oscillatoriales bacterium UBA8482]|nr:MAG: transcriptional regulator [Oscillatoriales cyanobacterium CG2_30_40_61]HBW58102.1 transcriptional regulator [Oscillatoriales bacterium UBA8482]